MSDSSIPEITPVNLLALLALGSLGYYVIRLRLKGDRSAVTPADLQRPPLQLRGLKKRLAEVMDSGATYERWAQEYGAVYSLNGILGRGRIMITDPKAAAHFFSRETFGYVQSNFSKIALGNLVSY
jgi:hypothetical protein